MRRLLAILGLGFLLSSSCTNLNSREAKYIQQRLGGGLTSTSCLALDNGKQEGMLKTLEEVVSKTGFTLKVTADNLKREGAYTGCAIIVGSDGKDYGFVNMGDFEPNDRGTIRYWINIELYPCLGTKKAGELIKKLAIAGIK